MPAGRPSHALRAFIYPRGPMYAAMALRAHKASRRQAYEVAEPNLEVAIRLASSCKNEALRNERKYSFVEPQGSRTMDVYTEAAFLDLIVRMSENVALIMILRVLYNDFGHAVTPHVLNLPPQFVTLRKELAAAILERRPDDALKLMKRRRRYLAAVGIMADENRASEPAESGARKAPAPKKKRGNAA